MTRTQLYLPESQYEKLKRMALDRRQTFASIIRDIIEEKLREERIEKDSQKTTNKISAWLSSLGKIKRLKDKNGIADGSVHHDKYLYGRYLRP